MINPDRKRPKVIDLILPEAIKNMFDDAKRYIKYDSTNEPEGLENDKLNNEQ